MNRPLALLIQIRHGCRDTQMRNFLFIFSYIFTIVLTLVDLLNDLLLDNLLKNCVQDQPHGLLSTEGICLYLVEKRKWKVVLCNEVSDSTPTTRHVYETSLGRPHKSEGEGGAKRKLEGKTTPMMSSSEIQTRHRKPLRKAIF